MRLVLDTSVLVSAAFWEGPEWRLLRSCLAGEHVLVLSPAIIEELFGVLTGKFELAPAAARTYALLPIRACVLVEPSEEVHVVEPDPSDDRVLEAAVAGLADAIASGDRHLLDLKEYRGIRIRRAPEL